MINISRKILLFGWHWRILILITLVWRNCNRQCLCIFSVWYKLFEPLSVMSIIENDAFMFVDCIQLRDSQQKFGVVAYESIGLVRRRAWTREWSYGIQAIKCPPDLHQRVSMATPFWARVYRQRRGLCKYSCCDLRTQFDVLRFDRCRQFHRLTLMNRSLNLVECFTCGEAVQCMYHCLRIWTI